MRVGDGFLLVYSLTKQSTLLNISALSAKINRVKHTHGHVPIVLVGNKVPMYECSVCVCRNSEQWCKKRH